MDLEGAVCAPCLADPPRHDGIRAVVAYGDVARTIILKLKHGRRPGIAKSLAVLAAPQMRELEEAIFAPVPLHRWRLWMRGFNQSLLIAQNLKLPTGAVVLPDLLIRTKATPMMRGLSRRERAKNVAGAFAVNQRYQAILKGRAVCLVDDVYTSGATVNACAAILKKAGASKVVALCWARVLEDDATY